MELNKQQHEDEGVNQEKSETQFWKSINQGLVIKINKYPKLNIQHIIKTSKESGHNRDSA